MGHDQLKKCSKYHLVSLLNEKQRPTFDIFVPFLTPLDTLTNSALLAARSVQGREHNFYLIIIADLRRVLPLHRKWCQQRLMTMFEWKQHFTCLWKCPKCDWKPLKRKHGSLSISDISRDSSLRLQGSTRISRLQ